jgi:hypothetical protein
VVVVQPVIIASLAASVLSPGLLAGFELVGIDGLILLATLAVLIIVIVARPGSEPRDATTLSRDEQFIVQALSANPGRAGTVSSLAAIAPASPVTAAPNLIGDPETIPQAAPRPMAQPASGVP